MKVTRLGDPPFILNSGFGYASQIPGPIGAAGTVVTSDGSNGSYWGENVARITSNGSNTLLGPFVNFASGSNITFSIASNTLTIHGQAGGGGGNILTANGSNSLAAIVNLVAGSGIALGVSGQDITISNIAQGGGAGGGGSGDYVLLETHSAAGGVAQIDFTTRNVSGQSGATFQTDFESYELVINGMTVATDGAVPYLRFSTNGGSSFDSSAIYSWINIHGQFGTTTATQSAASSVGQIALFADGAGVGIDTNGDPGFETVLRMFNPMSSTFNKWVDGSGHAMYNSGAGINYSSLSTGFYASHTAVNAFRVVMSTGNIAAGEFRLYGRAKT